MSENHWQITSWLTKIINHGNPYVTRLFLTHSLSWSQHRQNNEDIIANSTSWDWLCYARKMRYCGNDFNQLSLEHFLELGIWLHVFPAIAKCISIPKFYLQIHSPITHQPGLYYKFVNMSHFPHCTFYDMKHFQEYSTAWKESMRNQYNCRF